MILTRKIKLVIVSENREEGYNLIRTEIREQHKALNLAYNHLYFEHNAIQKLKQNDEDYKQKRNKLQELINKKYEEHQKAKNLEKKEALREAYNNKKQELYNFEKEYNEKARQTYQQVVGFTQQTRVRNLINRECNLMSDTKDGITSKVTQDYKNDCKAGLLIGKRSLRNYKKDNPLLVRGRSLKFYKEDGDYFIKWNKGTIFKCILHIRKKNVVELQSVLENVLLGAYKVCDSSIGFNNKDMILNLSLNIPDKETQGYIPGRVVGVDLGLKIPAYLSLSDKVYVRKGIGSIDDFLRVRTQMQKRRRRLQKSLAAVKGGKGREKKLKALDHLKGKEANFAKTYNHFLSTQIVTFAVKNQAGQINMEFLEFDKMKNKSLLRNWSYYQLQIMVEYKAKREGIIIKYVDAYLTSQTCSKCDHYEDGQREKQENFMCKNCGLEVNADYNASQNIAKSTSYISDSTESEYHKKKQQVLKEILGENDIMNEQLSLFNNCDDIA
ncbi:RNA-guided endonuclease TnpB family protein [Bacillus mycoides]|uniref:IS605 OrfB family transposase n=1 Tax=Bacillus cereus MC67 TaxID=1053219 RepID=J8FD11_BACCE|nr:RNA-guided endonuclease TnpB family protein [Bacillus cereus]EJQ98540.1 IS605 OrfB family transposase [Bacillus cereus MC67]